MDWGGKLVGGSLPVEASGLSYLRLSAPTLGKTSLISLSFLASCNNIFNPCTFRDRQSHYVREIVHVQGSRASNTYVWSESICLRHSSQHAFWLGSLQTHAGRHLSTGHWVL